MVAIEIVVALVVGGLVGFAVIVAGVSLNERRRVRAKQYVHEMVYRYGTHDADTAVRRERSRAVTPSLLDRLTPEWEKRRFRRQLLQAGVADPGAVDQILRRKAIGAALGGFIGLIVGVTGGGLWLLALPVLALAGLYLPELLLRGRSDERTEAIALGLPDALDLMNLSVSAGLGVQAALQHVAARETGPVADEFARVLQEIQLGIPRAEAFRSLAGRVRQPDLIRFAQAMVQVDRLGIPVARVLDEQSRDMRARRMSRAEEQAQKVSVKILGPLMACFLPALLLIVLTPAVISFLESS